MVGIKNFEMPSNCNSCEHWSLSYDGEPLCELTYEYISQFDKIQDDCPLVDAIPKADYEQQLKADMLAMLKELEYDLYYALCHEIHGKEDCPCTNQTTSCLATFRVCDADSAIGRVVQQKINTLRGEEE